MALYYYDKHNVVAAYYDGQTSFSAYSTFNGSQSGSASYAFSSSAGFTVSGSASISSPSMGATIYMLISSTIIEKYVVDYDNGGGDWGGTVYRATCTYHGAAKGTYIETVQAENGTYPDNGVSGLYWYVKGSLVPTGNALFFGFNF